MALGFFFILIQIAVVGGVITLVMALLRRRRASGQEGRAVTLRRAFTYSLAFVSLIVAGTGVTLLVRAILEAFSVSAILSTGNNVLALGLAMTVVGTPIWLLFWAAIQRTMRREPLEAQSSGRRTYFALIMAASAITAAIGAIQVVRWALGGTGFSSGNSALFLVWGSVWAFHWLTERREGPFTEDAAGFRRLYVYGMSLFGVVLLAVGVNGVLRLTLTATYHALFGTANPLVREFALWDGAMQSALATGIVGGLWWWGHWKRMAGEGSSAIRQVYLYLFIIMGGAVTVVTALSVGLYRVLQWLFGTPDTISASVHFDMLPGVVAAAVVGGALWVYHWAAAREEARGTEPGLGPAQRVYGYMVAAVGLGVLGAGMTVLLSTAIGLAAPRPVMLDFDWRDSMVLAVTLLVVGVPVWGGYWRDVQRKAVAGGATERAVMPRRVFIYLIFGLSILLVLVNLSVVLYRVFDALLGSDAGNVLWGIRWSLGMLLTAGAASGYYWAVLSEDRQAAAKVQALAGEGVAPVPLPTRKAVIVLAREEDVPLVRRLESALGYEIQVWERLTEGELAQSLSDTSVAEIARAIGQAASDKVMLLVNAKGIEMIPYRQRP